MEPYNGEGSSRTTREGEKGQVGTGMNDLHMESRVKTALHMADLRAAKKIHDRENAKSEHILEALERDAEETLSYGSNQRQTTEL